MDRIGHPTTTAGVFKLTPRAWPEPRPAHALGTNFDNTFTLLGYDAHISGSPSSQNLDIILYWRCDRRPAADFTFFVHVIDKHSNIVAQIDRPPLSGDYPTSFWAPGEVIQDRLTVSLPPPGNQGDRGAASQFWLRIGLYRPEAGTRLPVLDPAGRPSSDAATSVDPLVLP